MSERAKRNTYRGRHSILPSSMIRSPSPSDSTSGLKRKKQTTGTKMMRSPFQVLSPNVPNKMQKKQSLSASFSGTNSSFRRKFFSPPLHSKANETSFSKELLSCSKQLALDDSRLSNSYPDFRNRFSSPLSNVSCIEQNDDSMVQNQNNTFDQGMYHREYLSTDPDNRTEDSLSNESLIADDERERIEKFELNQSSFINHDKDHSSSFIISQENNMPQTDDSEEEDYVKISEINYSSESNTEGSKEDQSSNERPSSPDSSVQDEKDSSYNSKLNHLADVALGTSYQSICSNSIMIINRDSISNDSVLGDEDEKQRMMHYKMNQSTESEKALQTVNSSPDKSFVSNNDESLRESIPDQSFHEEEGNHLSEELISTESHSSDHQREELVSAESLSSDYEGKDQLKNFFGNFITNRGNNTTCHSLTDSIVPSEELEQEQSFEEEITKYPIPEIVLSLYPANTPFPGTEVLSMMYDIATSQNLAEANNNVPHQVKLSWSKSQLLSFEEIILPSICQEEAKALKKHQGKAKREYKTWLGSLSPSLPLDASTNPYFSHVQVLEEVRKTLNICALAATQAVHSSRLDWEEKIKNEQRDKRKKEELRIILERKKKKAEKRQLKAIKKEKKRRELKKRLPKNKENWREVAKLMTELAKIQKEQRVWDDIMENLKQKELQIIDSEKKGLVSKPSTQKEENNAIMDAMDETMNETVAEIADHVKNTAEDICFAADRIQKALKDTSEILRKSDDVQKSLGNIYRKEHQFVGYSGVDNPRGLIQALTIADK